MSEITSTHDIAEAEWDGLEPGDVASSIVATHEPEGRGYEFHVSMRDYTQRDMEGLIIEAAAQLIVGRHNDSAMAKAIEAKCIELINKRTTEALAGVTAEIIEQPIIPTFGDKNPVTMREFIGLCGREFLMQRVDSNGSPSTSGYGAAPRIEHLVQKLLGNRFKDEIEKATNAAIAEVRLALKAKQDALLAAEKARFREYIAKGAA